MPLLLLLAETTKKKSPLSLARCSQRLLYFAVNRFTSLGPITRGPRPTELHPQGQLCKMLTETTVLCGQSLHFTRADRQRAKAHGAPSTETALQDAHRDDCTLRSIASLHSGRSPEGQGPPSSIHRDRSARCSQRRLYFAVNRFTSLGPIARGPRPTKLHPQGPLCKMLTETTVLCGQSLHFTRADRQRAKPTELHPQGPLCKMLTETTVLCGQSLHFTRADRQRAKAHGAPSTGTALQDAHRDDCTLRSIASLHSGRSPEGQGPRSSIHRNKRSNASLYIVQKTWSRTTMANVFEHLSKNVVSKHLTDLELETQTLKGCLKKLTGLSFRASLRPTRLEVLPTLSVFNL